MNAKQSLKLAAAHIEELEYANRRYAADVKAYNLCIDGMIKGESPCKWCEEQNECLLEAKERGVGCTEWWLMDLERRGQDETDNSADDGGADSPVSGYMPS